MRRREKSARPATDGMINDRRVAVIESEQGRTSRQNLRMRAARDFARMSFFTSRERVIVPILITSQPSRTAKRLHRRSSWSECPNSAGNRPGSLWQSFCNYRPTAFPPSAGFKHFWKGPRALWTDFVPKVAAKSSSSRGERTSRVHRRKPAQSESFDNGGGRDAAGSRQESRTRKPFCI